MPDLRIQPNARTNAELKTQMRLAPELLSGLKVLSLPIADLVPFAVEAAERNPLLEVDYSSDLFGFDVIPSEVPANERGSLEEDDFGDVRASAFKTHVNNGIASRFEWDFSRMGEEGVEDETLHGFLRVQIGNLHLSPDDVPVMEALIEYVGEDGYFDGQVSQVAFDCGVSIQQVEKNLRKLKSLQPAGVASQSLAECLLAQISPCEPLYDRLRELVCNHLDDLAANRMSQLARALGVSIDDLAQMKAVILGLNPRPGQGFYTKPSSFRYVIPDIVVRKEEGGYEVCVTGAERSCLKLNADYMDMLDGRQLDSDVADYLQRCADEAATILDCIDARRSTLCSFASYLLRYQYAYFISEGKRLEPMTMQQVADELGVHVSTISRTVRGKYMRTPWGCVSLKSMFTRGIKTSRDVSANCSLSSSEIKRMIRDMIDSEPIGDPYSDTVICERLNASGVAIKRRTVAKYRSSMGIGTQSSRKWAAISKSAM